MNRYQIHYLRSRFGLTLQQAEILADFVFGGGRRMTDWEGGAA